MTGTVWLLWALAFLGFPIGGLLAHVAIGPVASTTNALAGGMLSGTVIGLAQWLALRAPLGLPVGWIAATSAGLAIGLAIAVTALGTGLDSRSLVVRGLIVGAAVGVCQAYVMRGSPGLGRSTLIAWPLAVTCGWGLGWTITRAVGVDLAPQWTVFGSTGALAFQIVTGCVLHLLARN